ncbi:MAG: translation initiation factor IF-3 [Acidobacteria bacterium]|jgi:translation initiation factor IF-3|nr:translation initiation factor IF-3 [Acidobacteriota bacterium]
MSPEHQERHDLPQVRINERIHFSPVRLIDEEGGQVGIVPVEDALRMAQERGLDLVEVAPDARPVVCRIMDFGRFRFEQQKKARAASKKQHTVEIKQIKYRPAIDDHDFETKTKKVRDFLSEGHKVRVTVMFRRRDMRRPENGQRVLQQVIDTVQDVGQVEDRSRMDTGRDLSVTIAPAKKAETPAKGSEARA